MAAPKSPIPSMPDRLPLASRNGRSWPSKPSPSNRTQPSSSCHQPVGRDTDHDHRTDSTRSSTSPSPEDINVPQAPRTPNNSSRGGYRCGRCGQAKKGHTCTVKTDGHSIGAVAAAAVAHTVAHIQRSKLLDPSDVDTTPLSGHALFTGKSYYPQRKQAHSLAPSLSHSQSQHPQTTTTSQTHPHPTHNEANIPHHVPAPLSSTKPSLPPQPATNQPSLPSGKIKSEFSGVDPSGVEGDSPLMTLSRAAVRSPPMVETEGGKSDSSTQPIKAPPPPNTITPVPKRAAKNKPADGQKGAEVAARRVRWRLHSNWLDHSLVYIGILKDSLLALEGTKRIFNNLRRPAIENAVCHLDCELEALRDMRILLEKDFDVFRAQANGDALGASAGEKRKHEDDDMARKKLKPSEDDSQVAGAVGLMTEVNVINNSIRDYQGILADLELRKYAKERQLLFHDSVTGMERNWMAGQFRAMEFGVDISSVYTLEDGHIIAGTAVGGVEVWTEGLEVERSWKLPIRDPVIHVTAATDNQHIFASTFSGNVYCWNDGRRDWGNFKHHSAAVVRQQVLGNGTVSGNDVGEVRSQRVVTAAKDGAVHIHDLKLGRTTHTLTHPIASNRNSKRRPDALQTILQVGNNHLITGSSPRNFRIGPSVSTVCLWDISQGSKVRDIQVNGSCAGMTAIDDHVMVRADTGYPSFNIELMDLRVWGSLGLLEVPKVGFLGWPVNVLELSGHILYSAHENGVVREWDLRTRKAVNCFGGHSDRISSLLVRHNMLVTNDFGTIVMRDRAFGGELYNIDAPISKDGTAEWSLSKMTMTATRLFCVDRCEGASCKVWDFS